MQIDVLMVGVVLIPDKWIQKLIDDWPLILAFLLYGLFAYKVLSWVAEG